LPPCHYTFAFNVSPDERGNPRKLNCHLTQRSGDIALGIPFNLACYATLTQMIAQEVGLELGHFAHTIIDAHIYCADEGSPMAAYDHVRGLREQLTREPRPLPKLVIAKKPFGELSFEDFRVEGYDPHPSISFKVAV
jgi:thymidylate synthase